MFEFLLRALRRQLAVTHRSDLARARSKLCMLGLYLVAIGVLHVAAMMVFEDLDLGEAAWLTATTATTVGYGDIYPVTIGGRLFTVVVLMVGIGIVAVPAAM